MPTKNAYNISYLLAIAKFTLSFTIYEIFVNKIKCQKCDLEYEGQSEEGEKLDMQDETATASIFFSATYDYAKGNRPTSLHIMHIASDKVRP